jgi:hypothetical protein
MEAAMDFLAETDERYALAKADVLRAEIVCKRIRARVFVGESGAVELKKAKAETFPEVMKADEEYCNATLEFETLKAKRSRAEILIDVYRTLEASRRKS